MQGLQGGKDPHGFLHCARPNTSSSSSSSASSGGSAFGAITAPDAPPGIQPSNKEASQDVILQSSPNPAATAATEMPKFMEFPGEIRDMVWEFAIADSKNAASAQAQHDIRDVDIAELDVVCL